VARDAHARDRPVPKRQQELYATAAEVFFEKGYDATSTEDIALRLGLLKGSIYYYIDSKEELLFSIIKQAFEPSLESLAAVESADATPLAKLRMLIERHVCHLIENRAPSALVLHEARSLTGEHRDWLMAAEGRYVDGFVALITAAQRAGEVRSEIEPRFAALALLGSINWTYRWYRADGEDTPQELAAQFCDVLIRGFEAPPAARRTRRHARRAPAGAAGAV
jgi:AcrR family transcriptional regulator